MSQSLFFARQIITHEQVIDNGAILVEDGVISWIGQRNDYFLKFMDLENATVFNYEQELLVPGFIDMHTHGALGIDFIHVDNESIDQIAQQFALEGTTSFLTSTMVQHPDVEKTMLKRLGELKRTHRARNLGIHFEGPYMNQKYKAMMDGRYLRNPDIQEIQQLQIIANNKIKMITMAPELEGAESFIEHCVKNGIIVMIGHTDATAKQALRAIEWGASGFTHLYNAMSHHYHRNPGVVTGALLSSGFSELIVDGYHIDEDVVKLTHNILKSDQIMIITDSTLAKGIGDGKFIFGGVECEIKDGKAFNVETGRIAGSTVGMDEVFKNMIHMTGCSLVDAVRMSSFNIAKCLKVDDKIGSIQVGKFADFAILNQSLEVVDAFLEGQCTTK